MKIDELPKKIPVGQAKDLTGKQFNELTVLYRCEPPKNMVSRGAYWLCQCSCSEYTIVRGDQIRSGAIVSCGHIGQEHRAQSIRKDLTGQRFGQLVALYPTDERENAARGCVLWMCQCDCGRTKTIPTAALLSSNSTSCGFHNISKGANKIEQILIDNNIKYNTEYVFKGCKNKGYLRFDFYLPDYNICIEYDGEQHFEETTMCEDSLEERQYRDKIKNQYCEDNGIKLIRIPYWKYNNITLDMLLGINHE